MVVVQDDQQRLRVLALTSGNAAGISPAPVPFAAGPVRRLIADKGYDAHSLRQLLAPNGAQAVIPSTTRRKRPTPHDIIAYRQRNLIEGMFGRHKDFRRIATRYDKLARDFLASVALAAIVTWWLN